MANDTWRAVFGFFREIENEQVETNKWQMRIFYLFCLMVALQMVMLLALTVLIARGA
jgi:hypothetical protein